MMSKWLAINDNSICYAIHESRNFNCNLVTKMAILCEACHAR